MKALVLEQYGQLTYRDVPDPVPEPGEVLVRIRAAGICGSDVHGLDGSTGRRQPPVIMGHEAAGEIAALGADVEEWQCGQRVTFDSTVSCGRCGPCRSGRVNLCRQRRVLGVSCEEYRRDGAFAEFLAVPAHILYRLPEPVSFEAAALVEPLAVAVHAVNRTPAAVGDSAVVVGAGMIGLLIIQVLRAAGFAPIVAVEPDETRRRLALELGADVVLDPDADDMLQRLGARLGKAGADHAFEVVGNGDALALAVDTVDKGGTVTLVGNVAPHARLPLQKVVTGELSLLASCASSGEYPVCLAMLGDGRVRSAPLISAVAPLATGDTWFQRLFHGEDGLLKVILRP